MDNSRVQQNPRKNAKGPTRKLSNQASSQGARGEIEGRRSFPKASSDPHRPIAAHFQAAQSTTRRHSTHTARAAPSSHLSVHPTEQNLETPGGVTQGAPKLSALSPRLKREHSRRRARSGVRRPVGVPRRLPFPRIDGHVQVGVPYQQPSHHLR